MRDAIVIHSFSSQIIPGLKKRCYFVLVDMPGLRQSHVGLGTDIDAAIDNAVLEATAMILKASR